LLRGDVAAPIPIVPSAENPDLPDPLLGEIAEATLEVDEDASEGTVRGFKLNKRPVVVGVDSEALTGLLAVAGASVPTDGCFVEGSNGFNDRDVLLADSSGFNDGDALPVDARGLNEGDAFPGGSKGFPEGDNGLTTAESTGVDAGFNDAGDGVLLRLAPLPIAFGISGNAPDAEAALAADRGDRGGRTDGDDDDEAEADRADLGETESSAWTFGDAEKFAPR